MMTIKAYLRGYLNDERGAITIDWVALTAGILLLGIAVIWAIFNNGVTPLTNSINASLKTAGLGVSVGSAPDMTTATGEPPPEPEPEPEAVATVDDVYGYPEPFAAGMALRDDFNEMFIVADASGTVSTYGTTSGGSDGTGYYQNYNATDGSWGVYDRGTEERVQSFNTLTEYHVNGWRAYYREDGTWGGNANVGYDGSGGVNQ